MSYMVITVAACPPAAIENALSQLGACAQQLKSDAGAISVRYGVGITGDHAGDLGAFQLYEDFAGIERAFGVLAGSSDYQALMATEGLQIKLRNIVKLEDVQLPNPSGETPAFGWISRFGSDDLMLDKVAAIAPVLRENGAMVMRYGTLLTGSAAGRRLIGVTFPSMDAIERSSAALAQNDAYKAIVTAVDLDFRNFVRFAG